MYAVYTDTIIISIGRTEDEAIQESIDVSGLLWSEQEYAEVAPVTPELYQHVLDYGGAGISWDALPDGTLDIEHESQDGEFWAEVKAEMIDRLDVIDTTIENFNNERHELLQDLAKVKSRIRRDAQEKIINEFTPKGDK